MPQLMDTVTAYQGGSSTQAGITGSTTTSPRRPTMATIGPSQPNVDTQASAGLWSLFDPIGATISQWGESAWNGAASLGRWEYETGADAGTAVKTSVVAIANAPGNALAAIKQSASDAANSVGGALKSFFWYAVVGLLVIGVILLLGNRLAMKVSGG